MQTIDQGHCQHVVEEVHGVGVVVGVSTWKLSSWFKPPNGFVKKSCGTRQQSIVRDMSVAAMAKVMAARATKDDKANVMTTTTPTTLMTTTTNKMTKTMMMMMMTR